MATVTVSLFGDKELEVEDSEVEVLRGQGILTSVDGVAEEASKAEADLNVQAAPQLLSVGDKPPAETKAAPVKEKSDGGSKAT